MNRLSRAVLVGIVLSLLFVAVSASPAAAVVQIALCSGTYEQTFDPGITNTPQHVDTPITSTYTDCVTTDSDLTSASAAVSGPIEDASCVILLESPSSGQSTLMWNTGETTVYDWTSTATQVEDTYTITVVGKVVAGKFVGGKVLRESTFLQEDLESHCSSSDGLTYASGPAILKITKLL